MVLVIKFMWMTEVATNYSCFPTSNNFIFKFPNYQIPFFPFSITFGAKFLKSSNSTDFETSTFDNRI